MKRKNKFKNLSPAEDAWDDYSWMNTDSDEDTYSGAYSRKRRRSFPWATVLVIAGAVVLLAGIGCGGFLLGKKTGSEQAAPVAMVYTAAAQGESFRLPGLRVTAKNNYDANAAEELENEQEFVNAANALRREGAVRAEFILQEGFFDADSIHRLAALAGMEEYEAACAIGERRLIYENIVWSELPVLCCYSAEDVTEAVRTMAQAGERSYTLVLDAALFETLCGDRDWEDLLAAATAGGFKDYENLVAYRQSGRVTLYGVITE